MTFTPSVAFLQDVGLIWGTYKTQTFMRTDAAEAVAGRRKKTASVRRIKYIIQQHPPRYCYCNALYKHFSFFSSHPCK